MYLRKSIVSVISWHWWFLSPNKNKIIYWVFFQTTGTLANWKCTGFMSIINVHALEPLFNWDNIEVIMPIEGYIKCTTTRTLHLKNLSNHSTYMEIGNTLSQCPLWNIWYNLNKKATCLGVFMQPSSEISCHDAFVFHCLKFLDGNFKKSLGN